MDNKDFYTGIGISMALLSIFMWVLSAPHWIVATMVFGAAFFSIETISLYRERGKDVG